MNRLPVRVRLALAFALALAVVLAATGAVLYLRLESSLDEAIDESLQSRVADVAALTASGNTARRDSAAQLVDPEESFFQVLDPAGRVVYATARAAERPVLDPEELASERVRRFERREVPGIEGQARVLATAIDTAQGRRLVVAGASLEDRDEALSGLLAELLVVGPAALVLVSLLGYGIATAALRPVESMRAEAAAISAAEPGRRLPLPSSRDEIARLAETLNGMLDRLEAALERERSFIADASHELRTPLALLKAELELALRRPRSAAELERALRSAAAETDRLAQLAEDLLVLARSEQGRLALHRVRVPAGELVAAVAGRFAHSAEGIGRTIESDAPDGLELTADGPRLEQALGNLVANALEHGRGPIRLTALDRDGRVEIHVLDAGPGFPAAFLPHAFERFSRGDQARSGGGAGLGLAIAALIACAHGGSAHAANRAGGGADVWLSIPNGIGSKTSAGEDREE